MAKIVDDKDLVFHFFQRNTSIDFIYEFNLKKDPTYPYGVLVFSQNNVFDARVSTFIGNEVDAETISSIPDSVRQLAIEIIFARL